MRKSIFLLSIIAVLALALPAFADEAEDYIDEEVAEWTEIANNNDFVILDTIVEMVRDEVTIRMELAPGVYHFYSSGGLHVEDLDLYISDAEGMDINSDTLVDKIPIVVILLDEPTIVDIRVDAWSYEAGYDEGYYCLLITCEDDGDILEVFE